MNVNILTAPVGTGKSTLLLRWIQSHPESSFCGFISVHERREIELRKLLLLPQMTQIPFEDKMGDVFVGQFKFRSLAFSEALDQLNGTNNQSIVIIDEIGKLEIQNQGFEPRLSEILKNLHCNTLIVVVRLGLLDAVMNKYPCLFNAKINEGPWIPNRPKVNGLVLGGGHSTRMGKPKFSLIYHGIPQYVHMQNLMAEVIDGEIFINVPIENSSEIQTANLLPDAAKNRGKGPVSGLLTAIEKDRESSWLVTGVDYPNVSIQVLKELYTAYQVSGRSVCFVNSENGFLEPLVALYSASDLSRLKGFVEEGNESLRHFLSHVNCLALPLTQANALLSVDTDAQAVEFIKNKH